MESMLTKIIRILLGLLLLVAGSNKFLHFMPEPPHPDAVKAFMGGLASAPYMFPLIATVECLTGLAFVAGRFVALAAVVLTPIAINIVLFHATFDPAGGGPGFFVGAATIYLLAVNLPKYQDMLMPR